MSNTVQNQYRNNKAKIKSSDTLFKDTNFKYEREVNQVVRHLSILENEDLRSIYGTSQEKSETFHRQNQDIFNSHCAMAIERYTGVVYEYIDWNSLNDKAKKYIHKNNCWEAWSWGRADFKYDVKQDRVVFLVKNRISHKIVGAVGRALNKNEFPKWYMYGNKDVPFKCGECEDSVIVEDCPSACAVSNVLTGIAIMGTKLKQIHKSHLQPYKKLYICLDRDATTKAYDMAKDLRSSGFENVIVKPLEDDLKYFNTCLLYTSPSPRDS